MPQPSAQTAFDGRGGSPARGHGLSVRLAAVRRVFDGQVVALDGLDLWIPAGQFMAVLGPSGCGKSTLLRLAAALDEPDGGHVEVDQAPLTPATARRLSMQGAIAYVFQDPHLMPWRSVVRNVALPLELRGINRRQRQTAALTAIAQVDLADAADRYPSELSGGMRMRASLARALVTDPRLLLLDEPFAAVDEMTRQRLDEQLRRLYLNRGMTVVFVTHSIPEAVFLADRVVVLSRRPGRIIGDETLDLPTERAQSLRTDHRFSDAERRLYDILERPSEA